MNMLRIARKETKQHLRDVRTFVFMVAFPILLMLVLGTALSNAFNPDAQFTREDIHVLYTGPVKSEIMKSFGEFAKGTANSGIHLKQGVDKRESLKQLKQDHVDGYVEVSDQGLHLYVKERSGVGNSMLQGILSAFADRYHTALTIAKTVPDRMKEIMAASSKHDYIADRAILPERQPDSISYYAIVMTTMITMYAAMAASSLFMEERILHTASRLLIAPVHKYEIFIGKIAGSLVINGICIAAVVLFSSVVFDANWGQHPGWLALLLLTEIIFAISFGLGIGFITKTPATAGAILMIVLQVMSFFGGAYFKIENPEGIMKILTQLSPLTWENNAILKMAYADDLSALLPAMYMNIGFAIVFMALSITIFRKREGL
ncbi:ABC transporter permease [Virgibacillus sp. 179-BFC.A HS]|uniref:ABC transporter permease n=1 Tax=Tigheibacillus jepli TaxID=3035914 RepID=A0ABU5CKP4_9BACI|nr:ABC transporter permease [Virgibacillus sp. 179-BFC.A HS]MDY0406937.1 ABC transporter permease [Virgibacillus sp. 179-BFC.A HS]